MLWTGENDAKTGVTRNNASDYHTNGHYRTLNPNPNPSPLARCIIKCDPCFSIIFPHRHGCINILMILLVLCNQIQHRRKQAVKLTPVQKADQDRKISGEKNNITSLHIKMKNKK